MLFFFNDTAPTEIYTLSLHDALPISNGVLLLAGALLLGRGLPCELTVHLRLSAAALARRLEPQLHWTLPAYHRYDAEHDPRSEEHTSELQSRQYLVCRLLLEKKKKNP